MHMIINPASKHLIVSKYGLKYGLIHEPIIVQNDPTKFSYNAQTSLLSVMNVIEVSF